MKRTRKAVARTVLGSTTGLAVVMGGCGSGAAQEMIQPILTLPTQEAATRMLENESRNGMFKLAMFDIYPRASGSVYYDDNIDINSVDSREDVVWTFSPGLSAVALGGGSGEEPKSLQLDYSPSFLFYTHHSSENTVNQWGRVAGVWPFAKLTLGFNQTVRTSTGPVIDVGGRTEQLLLGTALTSRYAVGEKTSVEINGELNISDYSDGSYTSAWDWSNQDWFNYQVGAKLSVGVGLVLGYIDLKDAPDQNYEDILVRAVYALAEKVSVTASVGADWRQYRSGVNNALNPVWNVGATYQPWDTTALSLGLYQRYRSSALYGDQDYLSTGVNLSLRQQLLKKLSLSLAGSYYHASYEAIQMGVVADRRDDVFEARTSLDFQIQDRWSASLFYAFGSDQSNLDQFTFNRNQVGLQTTWVF